MAKPQGKNKPAKGGRGLTVSLEHIPAPDAQALRRAIDLVLRAASRARVQAEGQPGDDYVPQQEEAEDDH